MSRKAYHLDYQHSDKLSVHTLFTSFPHNSSEGVYTTVDNYATMLGAYE